MYKNLIKISLLLFSPLICFDGINAFAHEVKNNNKVNAKTDSLKVNSYDFEEKFKNDFDNYQSFEDNIKPTNQFKNLFGVGGFADQRLKNSAFSMWDTYEKEMSNQIGNKRLSGSDINNTFNESIKSFKK